MHQDTPHGSQTFGQIQSDAGTDLVVLINAAATLLTHSNVQTDFSYIKFQSGHPAAHLKLWGQVFLAL